VVGTAGTNSGTTSNPQINRTGLSFANLPNTYYIGSVNLSSSSLPVNFISFTASPVNKKVALSWAVSQEQNAHYFIIERSKDAVRWEILRHLDGKGEADTVSQYTTNDENPYNGLSYYRLRVTDPDGKQSYSSIRSVNFENKLSGLSIYPNPATNYIRIELPNDGDYQVTLLNSSGQRINNTIVRNSHQVELNVSDLKSGIYYFHIHHGEKIELLKFVIKK
jgi:hypothetical protein